LSLQSAVFNSAAIVGGIERDPPAIHDDRIYCLGTDRLVVLDASDGTLVYVTRIELNVS